MSDPPLRHPGVSTIPGLDERAASGPPGRLEGLSARVFPLRGSVEAQQALCERFLHQTVPARAGRFRAVGPYVYLMMVDYGRLSAPRNWGWFAQREILFCFPVHWYTVEHGRWTFRDWAIVTPFIYVDHDLSVPLGRQVYGWGKAAARLSPTLSEWMRDPRAPVTHAYAKTMVFPELYEGRHLRPDVFLEVAREPPASLRSIPPDPESMFAPWRVATASAHALTGWCRDYWSWLRATGLLPLHPGGAPENLTGMWRQVGRLLAPGGGGLFANTLNLKQFRLSEDPELVCYQALTNGRMRLKSFNASGGLGDARVLCGDLSGGYTIRMHEWPSLAIVDSLGLDVRARYPGKGATVAVLEPILPFWYNVDMEYGEGETVAWRASDGVWRYADGSDIPAEDGDSSDPSPRYNTSVSSGQEIEGPFEFRGTTVRVLPLLARYEKLKDFLTGYLGELCDEGFEIPGTGSVRLCPWTQPSNKRRGDLKLPLVEDDTLAYVYLTAWSFGEVVSQTNNLGDWAQYEVSFLVPVVYEVREEGAKEYEARGVGLVPAFTFVDDTAAEVARAEVLGMRVLKADFVRPDSAWMSEEIPLAEGRQVLLRVDRDLFPTVGEGQGTQPFTLVEISEQTGDVDVDDGRTWEEVERWGDLLKLELERKKRVKRPEEKATQEQKDNSAKYFRIARSVALETIGRSASFAFYTMKTFRDVEEPGQTCYQALVRFRRELDQVLDIREIEQLIRVRIHDSPTMRIMHDLGIEGNRVTEDAAGVLYETHAVRPFFMSVTMNESLGERLMWKAGTLPWQAENVWLRPAFSDERAERLKVSRDGSQPLDWEQAPDLGDPRRVRELVRLLLDHFQGEGGDPLQPGEAMQALQVVDPQVLIECVLSREWGNRHTGARWVAGRLALEEEYRRVISGIGDERIDKVEKAFFTGVRSKIEQRPGQVRVVDADDMVERRVELVELREELRPLWEDVSAILARRLYGERIPDIRMRRTVFREKVEKLLDCLEEIQGVEVLGWPMAPDDWKTFSGTSVYELQARLGTLLERKRDEDDYAYGKLDDLRRGQATPGKLVQLAPEVYEAVALAHAICDLQREALFMKLAKKEQKPDFCVLRATAGRWRKTVFPPAWSWDEEWYFGPPVKEAKRPGRQRSRPAPNGGEPSGEGGRGRRRAPAKKRGAPATKSRAPAKKGRAPAKRREAAAKKGAAAEKRSAPAKKRRAPAKKARAAAKKGGAPTKNSRAPAKKKAGGAPAKKKSRAPAKKKSRAPAKKSRAPAKKKKRAPRKQSSAPVKKRRAPAKKAARPARKAGATARRKPAAKKQPSANRGSPSKKGGRRGSSK